MARYWNGDWKTVHPEVNSMPIPVAGNMNVNGGDVVSPQGDSYGVSSICRQIAENVLAGSPATPKPQEHMRVQDAFSSLKITPPNAPSQFVDSPPQPMIVQVPDQVPAFGTPGTPEIQPFFSSIYPNISNQPHAQVSWNALLPSQNTIVSPQSQIHSHRALQQPNKLQNSVATPTLSPVPALEPTIPQGFPSSPPLQPPPPTNTGVVYQVPTSNMNNAQQFAQIHALMSSQQIQQALLMSQPMMYLPQSQIQPNTLLQNPVLLQQLAANQQLLALQQQLMSMNLTNVRSVPHNNTNPFQSNSGSNSSRNRNQRGAPPVDLNAIKSQLLEDFRNNRSPNLTLRDLGNHVCEFAMDQHGSRPIHNPEHRFIQQKLERADPYEKDLVYNAIRENGTLLMTDVFGNYVIQKFFENGDPAQREGLCAIIRNNVLKLALQMYGCRVIQKAIETCPEPLQMDIVAEIKDEVLRCIRDQNGNHVMQKIIERVRPTSQLQFIVDAIINERDNRVFELSTHAYGCRVIQRVLEHCTPEQKKPIIDDLYQRLEVLVRDQYGNYVIQHIVEHGSDQDREFIISTIETKVFDLSQHKFSSNVIERILQCANDEHKNRLIAEVCENTPRDQSPLMIMMRDQYANYVVQKMLDVADASHRRKMLFAIKPHIPQLRKVNYGKHIIAKLEKYFNKAGLSSHITSHQYGGAQSLLQHQMTF